MMGEVQMAAAPNSKKYISGLTLIEMLIGVVISTIIMGAMYITYSVVNQSYSQVTNKAKISRSGRDIVEMLIRDIRMAGFKYVLGVNTLTNDDGVPIPVSSYLDFNTEVQEVHNSHDPIIIIKDDLGYEEAKDSSRNRNSIPTLPREDLGYEALDTRHTKQADQVTDMLTQCCDKIHIVYDDFNQHDAQPYKRYRVTYYALAVIDGIKIGDTDSRENIDHYYSIFKTVEEWQQEMRPLNNPPDTNGEWVSDCDECYVEQKIRDHVVDMEFIATDENGRVLEAVRSDVSEPQKNINKVRAIDIRLTFRSKSKFFRFASKKLIQGFGARGIPFRDRYLRDSVIVTVFTRNIGI